jgi:hypothetical protein
MGHPTSFLLLEIDMSDTPKKATVRSPKQQERNEKLRKASKLLKNAGLKAPAPNIMAAIKMQNEGKSDDEIIAAIKEKQSSNNATRKAAKNAKPATAKVATKKNTTVSVKPANNTSNTASTTSTKVKSGAQASRNEGQKSLAQKFKNQGLKFYGAAVKYYTDQKKSGKTNNVIFSEIKERPNLQEQTRMRKNTTVKAANVVAPAANNASKKSVVVNKGVAKGSYVCEKCRYVANNTTRKNNKKNNKNKNNGPKVNVNEYMYREV